MIHAVAEGLALSLDEGASTAERLARESQRMDLSANLALARTTSWTFTPAPRRHAQVSMSARR